MPKKLSHYDRGGRPRMVDVSRKSATRREAEASGGKDVARDAAASIGVGVDGSRL